MFDSDESGWPANRIWFGVGTLLFVFFDALLGHQVAAPLLLMGFALAVASLASAVASLQAVRLRMQVALAQEAMVEARSPRRRAR